MNAANTMELVGLLTDLVETGTDDLDAETKLYQVLLAEAVAQLPDPLREEFVRRAAHRLKVLSESEDTPFVLKVDGGLMSALERYQPVVRH